jgi:hypothetical protein
MPIILATWEAEIRKKAVLGQPRQKAHKTPSQQKKNGRGGTPVISAMVGSIK